MPFLILTAVIFAVSRLINLTFLPIFADEAIYIRWAQLVGKAPRYFFISLSDGKTPLFMWLLAPFLKIINDPLVAGRLLSVISGLATLLGVYFLSKKLFSYRIAIIASLMVIFQPFLLFYDRLSLTDSLLTALVIWCFYVAYGLFQKPNLKKGIILGLLGATSLLAKPAAALFLLLVPAMLLMTSFKEWLGKIKQLLLPGITAVIIAIGIYSFLRISDAFHMINSRSADYLRSNSEVINHFFEYFPNTFNVFFSWLVSYLSWPALIILGLSLLLALKHRSKKIILLFLWSAVPFFVQIAVGKIIYPRYLLPTIPFLLIIISWGISQLGKTWFSKIIAIVLIAPMFFFWLKFDYFLITDPALAPLDIWEKNQYLYEWSAGYGLREITDYLNNLPEDKQALVVTEGSFGTLPNGLEIYFDQSENITILGIGFPSNKITSEMEVALQKGELVYLVFNDSRLGEVDNSRLKIVAEYPRPSGPKAQEKLLFFEVLP